jgi:pimeloyl-ACP methyl ester carboxylesterase
VGAVRGARRCSGSDRVHPALPHRNGLAIRCECKIWLRSSASSSTRWASSASTFSATRLAGALAQELARRAPNRVRRLVLCGTGPGLGGTPPRRLPRRCWPRRRRYYHPGLLALSIPHIAADRGGREGSQCSVVQRSPARRTPARRTLARRQGGSLPPRRASERRPPR